MAKERIMRFVYNLMAHSFRLTLKMYVKRAHIDFSDLRRLEKATTLKRRGVFHNYLMNVIPQYRWDVIMSVCNYVCNDAALQIILHSLAHTYESTPRIVNLKLCHICGSKAAFDVT